MVKRVLEMLEQVEAYTECMREIAETGYSKTLLKMLFQESPELLSYCLADQESSAFVEPIKTIIPKKDYRIVVGTDGIFSHLKEPMIEDIMNLRTIRFAIKGLVLEAFRRGKRLVDASGAIGALATM
jgi:hypothetical protein